MPEIPLNEFIDQQDTSVQTNINAEISVTKNKTQISKDTNPISLNEDHKHGCLTSVKIFFFLQLVRFIWSDLLATRNK